MRSALLLLTLLGVSVGDTPSSVTVSLPVHPFGLVSESAGAAVFELKRPSYEKFRAFNPVVPPSEKKFFPPPDIIDRKHSVDIPTTPNKRHISASSSHEVDSFHVLQPPYEWVHHPSTGSKHKFTVNNLGQSDQVLEQFWSGANGGKPYQTPEETKVEGDTTVDSGVERKTSHEELLTKDIQASLLTRNVEIRKVIQGRSIDYASASSQVERSGYSSTDHNPLDGWKPHEVPKFEGYDGLTALPQEGTGFQIKLDNTTATDGMDKLPSMFLNQGLSFWMKPPKKAPTFIKPSPSSPRVFPYAIPTSIDGSAPKSKTSQAIAELCKPCAANLPTVEVEPAVIAPVGEQASVSTLSRVSEGSYGSIPNTPSSFTPGPTPIQPIAQTVPAPISYPAPKSISSAVRAPDSSYSEIALATTSSKFSSSYSGPEPPPAPPTAGRSPPAPQVEPPSTPNVASPSYASVVNLPSPAPAPAPASSPSYSELTPAPAPTPAPTSAPSAEYITEATPNHPAASLIPETTLVPAPSPTPAPTNYPASVPAPEPAPVAVPTPISAPSYPSPAYIASPGPAPSAPAPNYPSPSSPLPGPQSPPENEIMPVPPPSGGYGVPKTNSLSISSGSSGGYSTSSSEASPSSSVGSYTPGESNSRSSQGSGSSSSVPSQGSYASSSSSSDGAGTYSKESSPAKSSESYQVKQGSDSGISDSSSGSYGTSSATTGSSSPSSENSYSNGESISGSSPSSYSLESASSGPSSSSSSSGSYATGGSSSSGTSVASSSESESGSYSAGGSTSGKSETSSNYSTGSTYGSSSGPSYSSASSAGSSGASVKSYSTGSTDSSVTFEEESGHMSSAGGSYASVESPSSSSGAYSMSGSASTHEEIPESVAPQVSYVPSSQLPDTKEESSYANLEEDHEDHSNPAYINTEETKDGAFEVQSETAGLYSKIKVAPASYATASVDESQSVQPVSGSAQPSVGGYAQTSSGSGYQQPSVPVSVSPPVQQPTYNIPQPFVPAPVFPQQQGYAQPQGGYVQPSGSYIQPSGGYVQPSGGYSQPLGSYSQPQQSCCGGQLFGQQGNLCMPINYSPCQSSCGGSSCGSSCGGGSCGGCGGGCQQQPSCGGCSPSCPSACQPSCGGGSCCEMSSPLCCSRGPVPANPCCNTGLQTCCPPALQSCCSPQNQSCCPPPIQSCCCSQSICRRRKRSIEHLLGICPLTKKA